MIKPVTLKSRWHEILGNKQADMPDKLRRQRWEEWKRLALLQREAGQGRVDYWTDCSEACEGCKYRDNDWCTSQQLPCTVNPTLTFSSGVIGMACMGAGYTPADPKQLELF